MPGHENYVKIGTCGYSYPGMPPTGWHGIFYPKKTARSPGELEFYASYFDAVEINSSFYRPPTSTMAEAWVQKTPPDFQFAVKAWQKFTHATKVGAGAGGKEQAWSRPNDDDVRLFADAIAPLESAGKLGALLFQFPASFQYNTENLARLEWTLDRFERYPKVVELRHRSWSDRRIETSRVLDGSQTTWAFIDEPKFASSVKQEFETGGSLLYVRLHGRNSEKWWNHREAWERYDYFYPAQDIIAFADKIKSAVRTFPKSKIFVFFNNHARGQAVANALMLKNELELEIRARLPRQLVEGYPQLEAVIQSEDRQTLF